jgi:UDP-galactopyranose mutase
MNKYFDNVIIGAGLTGITLAEKLSAKGESVCLIEKKRHIGGRCYDLKNNDGILVQKYGPHIFHTDYQEVWDYLSNFTNWIAYKHKVLAYHKDEYYPLPINLNTMNKFFNVDLTSKEMEEFIKDKVIDKKIIKNSKDVVVSRVGKELYEAFIKNYSYKQWDCYPEELERRVLERLPIRFNTNDYYFNDCYQGLPEQGYTQMFKKMLDNRKIKLMLNIHYRRVIDELTYGRLFVTSPIDEFFNYEFGNLPYRCINFTFEAYNKTSFQLNSVINFTDLKPGYTRVTEFKKLTGQVHDQTVICREFPSWMGEKTYPVPKKSNFKIYEKYKSEADKLKQVYFIGRMANYAHLDMDDSCKKALELVKDLNSYNFCT